MSNSPNDNGDGVIIRDGIQGDLVADALAMSYDAFESKFRVGFDNADQFVKLFHDQVNVENCIVATVQGAVAGTWLLTAALADSMPEGGRVINISSPGSGRVFPAYFAVGVSKAALEAVTRYMAVDLAPRGISVNAVSASFVQTDALNAFPDELGVRAAADRPTPAGRTVSPHDVANVVAMLCGPEAEMIRGQTITVDGGEMLIYR